MHIGAAAGYLAARCAVAGSLVGSGTPASSCTDDPDLTVAHDIVALRVRAVCLFVGLFVVHVCLCDVAVLQQCGCASTCLGVV
jgi:hypothetical protein